MSSDLVMSNVHQNGSRPSTPDLSTMQLSVTEVSPAAHVASDLWAYWIDSIQRQVLFLDVLRQRGNVFFEHFEANKPPLLIFDYEVVLDGSTLNPPVNYTLLRIVPPEGLATDVDKRPFVIIDPRAGHGPGIGGMKDDSQIGVALRGGFPVYFVTFTPLPQPGQTIEDISLAQAAFLREVLRRHPKAPRPCVIGNCQAGWAVALLASIEPDLMGPVIMNGAPLSYWAGIEGKNSMRYMGGLLGGSWVTSLLGDLGAGLFDGAYLVQNFERINPANTFWSKQYHLYANIDSEAPRYLGFERWWNGFFLLNTEEMEFIVENLFIGNRLASRGIRLSDGRVVNLRDIKTPVVIFASAADTITPPQQALSWISDVYANTDEIVREGQVIVYALHQDIGHLGIFVSGRVAQKEHSAIIGTMEFIDTLPPGLYEMQIEKQTGATNDPNAPTDYTIRLIERTIDDIRALDDNRQDERAFTAVAAISEYNTLLYKLFLRPWLRLFVNRQSAEMLRVMVPNRAQHYLLSDRNPAMSAVKDLADQVRTNRRPIAEDNPFLQLERQISQNIIDILETYRNLRDTSIELWFKAFYGPFGLGAMFPLNEGQRQPEAPVPSQIDSEFQRLADAVEQGGFAEGLARLVLLLSRADGDIEPRIGLLGPQVLASHPQTAGLDAAAVRQLTRDQFIILRMARERAIASLPRLLASPQDRHDALLMAYQIVVDPEHPNDFELQVLDQLESLLGVSRALPPAAEPVTPAPLEVAAAEPVVEALATLEAETAEPIAPEPIAPEPLAEAEGEPIAPEPQADADAEGEPVVPEVEPEVPVIPTPTKPAKAAKRPRLIDIIGIGPVYERRLKEAGITTFAELVAQTPERLREIASPDGRFDVDTASWITQAYAMMEADT